MIAAANEGLANLLALDGLDGSDPNVAESNGIAMILKSNRSNFRVFLVHGWTIKWGVPKQFKVIQNHSTVQETSVA